MRGLLLGGSLALSVLASPALAQGGHGSGHSHHGPGSGSLKVEQPWLRATPAGAKVAGGYVRIINTGAAPDRLVGGTVPMAGRFQVHEMSEEGGVVRMREIPGGLPVPAGATIELKPGGNHLMFLDLREPLKEGQTVEGVLQFEKAGAVPVIYRVLSIGARGPDGGHTH